MTNNTPKPGYLTSEHAIVWAIVLMGGIALFRGHDSLDRLTTLLAPAIASASYSSSRGRVKSPDGPGNPDDLKRHLLSAVTELFRTRIK